MWELHAFLGEFAYAREREDLEPTAVGEYRSVPTVELVQSAGAFENVEPRPQIEVIGVAQYDLGFYVVAQLVLMHGFDAAYGSYGHEYRGLYRSVVGRDEAGTGTALRVGML